MRKFVLLIAAVLSAGLMLAQNSKVTGTVSAPDGSPVAGATVLVEGTTVATITSTDGKFSIAAPSNANLMVSLMGYKTQEVPLAGKTNVNVTLAEDMTVVDDVVVIAYGKTTSHLATSSQSTIKSESLKDSPSVSIDQMMQGRAAGVSITTPNAGVGQAANIMVRGVASISAGTSPLYVVDGAPINAGDMSFGEQGTPANGLADINPADITSITVLKDAAATALYGSRAAAGVVLITTKQGRSGKAKVSYDMNIGTSNATHLTKMMNATQYTDFKNMAVKNKYGTYEYDLGGGDNSWGKKAFNLMTDKNGNTVDTDWAGLLYQNGLTHNHTVSVQGGSDRFNYYMSGNYTDQDGIIIGDNYNRVGVRANVSGQATDWLKVGFTANYTHSKTQSNNSSNKSAVFAAAGFPRAALILPPSINPYNDDGSYNMSANSQYLGTGGLRVSSLGYPHPLAQMESYDLTKDDRIIASGFVDITPIKNLSIKSQYNVDYTKGFEETFWSPEYNQGADPQYNGYCYDINSNLYTWTWTNTIGYNFRIKEDHNFDVLVGAEAYALGYNYSVISGTDIKNGDFTGMYPGYNTYDGGAARARKTMVSFFGRLNYDYKSKYLVSLNYRRDGLSSLGANTKWGDFYGVSAAWRISEEKFWESIRSTVNEFKFKASYGTVGNADIGYYGAQSYFSDTQYGGGYGVILGNIGDENLRWESSDKFDVGVSLQFLNNITLDVDYYLTKSRDLVFAVPQGPSTGIGSLVMNAGSLTNTGVEVGIGAEVVKAGGFSWTTNFNFTYAKNKVNSLAEGVNEMLGESEGNITIPGYSAGQLYVYPTGGIDAQTGNRIFYGPNGEWTRYDNIDKKFYLKDGSEFSSSNFKRVRAGNTVPTYYGGWTNTFRYKGFDLTLFLQYSGGNYIYNGTKATMSDYRWWNNSMDVYNNYWKGPGDKDAKYAKPVYGDNYSNGSAMEISDLVERGDYLRMKNICLGYTFNTKNWNKKLGISALRIYVQCQNVFVITGYSGLDPETTSYVTDSILSGGYDKNTLPQARTWTAGLNLTF